MLYNYLCLDCKKRLEAELGFDELPDDMFGEAVFETSHAAEPSKKELAEARICPRCQGRNTEKTMFGVDPVASFVKGGGFLDRSGCRRDMDLTKLTTVDECGNSNDPYAEYRQPGETDDLAIRLRRAGQHNPRTKYFPSSGSPQDSMPADGKTDDGG